MLTWLRTFLKSNTRYIKLWFCLSDTFFRKPVGSPGGQPCVYSPIKILPGARARTGAGIMPGNQIIPQMPAFNWFSADLSGIVQSNLPGPGPGIAQVPRRVSFLPQFHSEALTSPRLWPTTSSPRTFFLALPQQGPFSGVHILNPMNTEQAPRDDPPTPGLAPRRTTLPISVRYRCAFRTHRVQPDGSHRCMRDGATFIRSLQDSDLGAHVCTRHRALARRYTELDMSWTYIQPRQSLENTRASNGRFGNNLGDRPVRSIDGFYLPRGDLGTHLHPPGSEAAIITVFKSEFLEAQPIDWHLAESGTTCPICLDEQDVVITEPHLRLQCGHGMHMRCLSEFVLSGAVDLAADTVPCPLCRGDILPDIVTLRHRLLHKAVARLGPHASHPLRDLVFEDGHDSSPLEDVIDEEIRAFCVPPGPVKYISSKNPSVVCENWDELGTSAIADPTQEITEMVRPTTPIRATPPPAEQTTPPVFVNLAQSPPPTPRPDRRVRRRLDGQLGHNLQPRHVHLETGQLARAIRRGGQTFIGLDLSGIQQLLNTTPMMPVVEGTGEARYRFQVIERLTTQYVTPQLQLNLVIEDTSAE